MNRDLAIAYVVQYGTEADHARLTRLLRPGGDPEPGAAFWVNDPEPRTVDGSCFQLAQLEALGALDCPQVAEALAFLEKRQQADGTVTEPADLAGSLPSWTAAGDGQAVGYLTANAAFWLAVSGRTEPAGWARRALHDMLDPGAGVRHYLITWWLAAGALWLAGERELTVSFMDELHGRRADLLPQMWAWLGVTLLIAGVPAGLRLPVAAREALRATQAPDGSWGEEVRVTLEALRVVGGDDS